MNHLTEKNVVSIKFQEMIDSACYYTQMFIVLFCEDIDELNDILNIYDSHFSRFGLTIAIDKTQTLA